MKNNRTFLEKLLNGAEVEWKTLGEVAKIQRGASPRPISQYITDDPNGIPWIKIGDTATDSKYIERTAQKITPEGAEKSRVLKCGDFVMSNSMSYGRPYILKISGAIHDGWASISDFESILTPNFLYYYLSSNPVQDYWDGKINSSSVSNLNSDIIKSLPIPISPLSVQTKIVKILDALTALTSELTSELILRQKQYEYYREKLLSFDSLELSGGVVQWIKLIDLGELIRGNGLQKKDFTETGVPAIHYGQIYTYYGTFATETKSFVSPELAKKLKKAKYGDVLIAGTSENLKDVMKPLGWLGSEIAFSGDMFAFRPNKRINTKYLTYILQTERFYKFKEKYAQGTKVIRVKADNFLNYEIPLPTFEEQQRIVSILDKFETLTNSITEGLPLAIEQSQKRYEYYRELLLNFS